MAELTGPGWDLPAEVREAVDFHWFHVVPGRSLVLTVLSDAPVWYVGHYQGRRMRRCMGESCELCAQGLGSQVRYVLGAVEVATRTVGVIEMGKSNALLVRSWAGRNGGLRGMTLELSKSSSHKQSRMELLYIDRPAAPWISGLKAPDLAAALHRTWERMGSG
jgi:hypothetical protein